jgi:hypothetical protein
MYIILSQRDNKSVRVELVPPLRFCQVCKIVVRGDAQDLRGEKSAFAFKLGGARHSLSTNVSGQPSSEIPLVASHHSLESSVMTTMVTPVNTHEHVIEALKTLYFVKDAQKKQEANTWLQQFQKTVGVGGWAGSVARTHALLPSLRQ